MPVSSSNVYFFGTLVTSTSEMNGEGVRILVDGPPNLYLSCSRANRSIDLRYVYMNDCCSFSLTKLAYLTEALFTTRDVIFGHELGAGAFGHVQLVRVKVPNCEEKKLAVKRTKAHPQEGQFGAGSVTKAWDIRNRNQFNTEEKVFEHSRRVENTFAVKGLCPADEWPRPERFRNAYLVEEYASRGNMSHYIKNHKEGDAELEAAARTFAAQMLLFFHKADQTAQEEGKETIEPYLLVDFKPKNLLIDGDGDIKVADFGSVVFFKPGKDMFTVKEEWIKTVYKGLLPPELLSHLLEPSHFGLKSLFQRFKPPVITNRALDLYNLGAMLFRIEGREHPFTPKGMPKAGYQEKASIHTAQWEEQLQRMKIGVGPFDKASNTYMGWVVKQQKVVQSSKK